MTRLLLPASGHRRVPWKNGGGHTTEVLVRPDDGASPASGASSFDWRLSIATVDSDGSFSVFPGVDRCLMVLSLQGLDLMDDGTLVHLPQYGVHRFAGESVVGTVHVASATLDLNLMTRRSVFSGTLEYADLAGSRMVSAPTGGAAVAVVMLSGSLACGGRMMAVRDAVLLENGGTASFTGTGSIAVATVFPA